MAGLLDMFSDDSGLLGLHLLAAAGPQARPTSFGQRLLGGIGGYKAELTAAEERKQKKAMQELQMGLLNAQIGETNAQGQQRAAQAEALQRKAAQDALFKQALAQGSTTSPQQAMAGGGGPTMSAAAAVGQPRAMDWSALAMQHPDQIDLLQKLAAAKNFGREEVSNLDGVMPGTNMPATVFRNKFGDPQGQAVPKAVEAKLMNLGGSERAYNPFALMPGQEFARTNTPDALLSAETARRGQNMTDARSRDKNQIDANAVGKIEWKQDVQGNWIALPKEVNSRDPVTPITTTSPGKRETQAKNAIDILNEAAPLLKSATGSYAGAAADMAGRVVGYGTQGAQDTAKLKALEGALMMAQPRMEGPQSNLDVALYRQMAGQIGDPTIPSAVKQAAAAQVRRLHEKYAGSSGGATGSWGDDDKERRYQEWKRSQGTK